MFPISGEPLAASELVMIFKHDKAQCESGNARLIHVARV